MKNQSNSFNQTQEERIPILVVGIGNLLLKDDGFGIHAVRRLYELGVPEGVELMDGGTSGLDLLTPFSRADKVIVIDAVKGGGEPGAVYRFAADEVDPERMPLTSMHQLNLHEVLAVAKSLGELPPEVVVYGVEPKSIEVDLELSPEVAARLDKVCELVLQEIKG